MRPNIKTWRERLARSPRAFYILLADGLVLPICVWLGFSLVYGRIWPEMLDQYRWLVVLAPLVTLPIFMRLGLYRAIVRFMGAEALFVVLKAVTVSAAVLFALAYLAGGEPVFAAILVYWALATLAIGGGRMVLRHLLNLRRDTAGSRRRAIIYGAGDAGVQLVRAMQAGRDLLPVAFIDDNPELRHTVIHGVTVHSGDDLDGLMGRLEPDVLLMALPSASRQRRHAILKRLEPYPVEVKTLPNLEDLLSGRRQLTQLRDIGAADLLGRDPVPPREELLAANIKDRRVMVSGAGGSIGSELCRQILARRPRRLVLYELTEYALYRIYEELRPRAEAELIELVPVLGSVLDAGRLEAVIKSQDIETIYHAAAYKHVPLVEANPVEGLRNNFLGTWCIAETAQRCGVGTFLLISTDKAVRPTNVMGASKRLAELAIQGLADGPGPTRFVIVRFGNVLGSSGSVIPRFREQIAEGGPVTVTHPDITRYFMTIPEASQLVLQAGAMGRGGDVFVLDMGKPVRIVDLARQMIHLSGLVVRDEQNPAGDIDITYTGLRPGEKLYEELWIGDAITGTEHPKILRAEEDKLPWSQMLALRERIGKLCADYRDDAIVPLLLEVLPGYRRYDAVAVESQPLSSAEPEADAGKVVALHR